jgi:hypothetical protein
MAELRDNKPSAVVNIAAAGDIILVVGSEKVGLRVQSLILKAVSKPFSSMMSANWKEGRDLFGEDGLVELLLPEDNAMAMKYICAIIHHQNKMLPSTMTAHGILEVAIMADKYDFVDALAFASDSWLRPRNMKADELMVLAAAAYAFQNAQAFRDLTKELILNYGGSYLALSTKDIELVMSWRVFCAPCLLDSLAFI